MYFVLKFFFSLYSFKSTGIFSDDEIPKNVFLIGESVFVVVNTFKGSVKVHIRRYKKYGKIFYPTSEGITLHPSWIQWIMKRENVPKQQQELNCNSSFEKQIKITSIDFEHFTFSRIYSSNMQETFKSITLSALQWFEMLKRYDEISAIVLEYAEKKYLVCNEKIP